MWALCWKLETASLVSPGWPGAMASELLEFPNGVYGMALNLEENSVGAIILGDYTQDRRRRPGQVDRTRG